MATYQEYLDDIEAVAVARGWIDPDASPEQRAAAVEEVLAEGDHKVEVLATGLLYQYGMAAGSVRYPAAA